MCKRTGARQEPYGNPRLRLRLRLRPYGPTRALRAFYWALLESYGMRCHVPPPHVVLVQSSVPAAARFKFLCSRSLLLLIMAESKRRKRLLIREPSIETKALANTAAKAMQSRVMASWYHDGTLLDQLAHHHMTHFAEVLTSRPSHDIMPARMTWGSLCSGWGGRPLCGGCL